MTSKEMAAIAWKNMESFDWEANEYETFNNFERYVIEDASRALTFKQVKSYINELKWYKQMRDFIDKEIDEEDLKQEIWERIRNHNIWG